MADFHNALGRFDLGPLNLSIMDTVGTVVGGLLLSRWTGWNAPLTVGGLFIAGEAIHLMLGINTPVTQYIRGDRAINLNGAGGLTPSVAAPPRRGHNPDDIVPTGVQQAPTNYGGDIHRTEPLMPQRARRGSRQWLSRFIAQPTYSNTRDMIQQANPVPVPIASAA
jgi:hypothetical protein